MRRRRRGRITGHELRLGRLRARLHRSGLGHPLGDLYQDLSESARKRYAPLQTPKFVEELILDRTLNPPSREFGFRGVRLIDPEFDVGMGGSPKASRRGGAGARADQ